MIKHWPFFLGGLLIIALIGILGYFLVFSKSGAKSQDAGEIVEVEAPEISSRPFFSFAPRDDGKAIQVSISGIASNMQIDYEITYKAGSGLEQGIGGPAVAEVGQSFYTREHIFGTCSKNVCTYDKGVEFGKWKASVQQKNQVYELEGEWRLQNPGTKAIALGFEDKFKLTVDAGTFSKSLFVITSQNSSLPKKLPEGVKGVLGPFTIAASEAITLKKPAVVSFSTTDGTNLQILQLSTGEVDWKLQETKTDTATNSITAAASTFGTFILVEKI